MPVGESARIGKDTGSSFGTVSIVLHWLSAIFIIALWFIGDGIAALGTDAASERRELHVSIAVVAYLILWARIIWRLHSKHPQAHGQSRITHNIAQTAHYLLLAAIAGMLCSGPLIMWSNGLTVSIFGLFELHGPAEGIPGIFEAASAVHKICGQGILWLTVIHIGGSLKHLMFHDDETIARIFIPKRVECNSSKTDTTEHIPE